MPSVIFNAIRNTPETFSGNPDTLGLAYFSGSSHMRATPGGFSRVDLA
jgi:hypothetical protein